MDPFERVKRAVRDAITHSAGRPGAPQTPERGAEAALESGDFGEAERLLADTVEELRARPAERKRYSKALLMLASAQWKQEKLAEAKANAGLARPLLAESKQPADLAECLNLLGSIALEEQDAPGAAELFRQAVESAERARPQNPLTTSNILRRWSEALRRGGDHENAKSIAGRALNLVQDRYGKDDVNTGECLLELGRCEREGGDPAAAIPTLRRALDIFRLDRGRDSDHEVKTLQCLAEACQEVGDLDQAVGFYERALRERERQMGGKAEDAAALLTNLGGLLSLLGRHGPAIEFLQQAVVRLEGSRDDRLGSALDLLGNTYFQFGRFEDAVSCVSRARSIWESAPSAHGQALEANQALLTDIAGYLPQQRRVALGLAAAEESEPGSAAAAKRRRTPAPWDTPEPGRTANAPRQTAPSRPPTSELAPGPAAAAETVRGLGGATANPGFDPRNVAFPAPPGAVYASPQAAYPVQRFIAGAGCGWPVQPVYQPDRQAPQGVLVSLLRPDGSVVESGPANGGPVHLQIVLGEGGVPGVVTAASPEFRIEESRPAVLNGWDELGFDCLPAPAGKAG